jgi:hypothetical protein
LKKKSARKAFVLLYFSTSKASKLGAFGDGHFWKKKSTRKAGVSICTFCTFALVKQANLAPSAMHIFEEKNLLVQQVSSICTFVLWY